MLKSKIKRKNNFNNRLKEIDRHSVFFIISLFVFSFIIIKLIFLQIINYDYYSESAKAKSYQTVEIAAPRGQILDVNGTVLAGSKQSYVLTYVNTEDNAKVFYNTMEQVFDILDKKGEQINDDLPIKLNDKKDGVKFEFNAQDDEGRKTLENIFKNDIGLGDKFAKELFDKSYSELNDVQKASVKEKNLQMSAEDTYKYLVETLEIPSKYPLELQRKFVVVKNAVKLQSYSGFKAIAIASDLEKDTAMIFTEKLNLLPGVAVDQNTQRYYPSYQNRVLGSGFLGYISKISDERYKEQGYDLSSDYRGVSGVEAAFEDRLRGSKGAKIVEVNRSGQIISELAKREAYPGQDVYLTINADLQKVAEEQLQKTMTELQNNYSNRSQNATRGAVVALDVKTGGVLAMASLPGFDPNDFANPAGIPQEKRSVYFFGSGENDYENYAKANGWDKQTVTIDGKSYNRMEFMLPKDSSGRRVDLYDYFPKPLLNYATSSLEPPGSTFKPFTALAGLSEGVITAGTIINDPGSYNDKEGYTKGFPDDGVNGPVNLAKALEVSSNPYFMETGKRLAEKYDDKDALKSAGIDNRFDILGKYVWPLGLGVDPRDSNPKDYTGIEISENFGQVFNFTSLKNKNYTLILDKLMSVLNSGSYTNVGKKYTFPKIDLYKSDSDSEEIAKLKADIKNNIKDILSPDYTQDEKLSNIIDSKVGKNLQQLIKIDSKYQGVTFKETDEKTDTPGDIDNILTVIKVITYWDGYKTMNAKYNIYNASIGQGDTNVTPLQLASAFSTLLNGGTRYKVHLLDKVKDSDGNLIYQTQPEVISKIDIDKDYLEDIKQGMKQVLTGAKSSAAGVFKGFPISGGAKTGSATFLEGGLQEQLDRNAFAWFVNFAPYDDPEIVVVTVIFDGHFGRWDGPVNRAVTEEYFKLKGQIP